MKETKPEELELQFKITVNKVLLIYFLTSIVSCVEPVNKMIDEASEEIQSENLKSKQDLRLIYQNLLKSSDDTALKLKASLLYKEIIKTDNFLDSLQGIVKTLKRDDVKTVRTIKYLLAESAVSDSLNFYLRNIFEQAKEFSVNQNKERIIDSIQTNLFSPMESGKRWQSELFELSNPLGASYILYSIQSELYNVGKMALEK